MTWLVRPLTYPGIRIRLPRPRKIGPAARISMMFRTWIARSLQRQALRDLADRNDRHMLKDIGLRPEEALRETAKWFWQR